MKKHMYLEKNDEKYAGDDDVACEENVDESSFEYENKKINTNLVIGSKDMKDKDNQDMKYVKYIDKNIIDVDFLREAIKNGRERIDVADENFKKEAVLIIGSTGAGKSSIAMVLHGVIMAGVDPNDTNKVKLQRSSNDTKDLPRTLYIEDRAQSGTSMPVGLKDETADIHYWDTPGFGDNRGVTQDVINGYYIKRIFETHKKVKILFVASHSSITENKAKVFLEVVENLSDALDISKYKNSIGFVVTGAEHDTEGKHIINAIKHDILDAPKLKISEGSRKFLEFMSSDSTKIVPMEKPKKGDNPNYSTFKSNVINLVSNKLEAIESPSSLKTVISDDNREKVKQVYDSVVSELVSSARRYAEDIKKYVSISFDNNSIILDVDNLDKNNSLFEKIKKCKEFIQKLKTIIDKTDVSSVRIVDSLLVENISNCNNDINIKSIGEIKDHIITIDFFATILKNVSAQNILRENVCKLIKDEMINIDNLYNTGEQIASEAMYRCAQGQFKKYLELMQKTKYYEEYVKMDKEVDFLVKDITTGDKSNSLNSYLDLVMNNSGQKTLGIDLKCLEQLRDLQKICVEKMKDGVSTENILNLKNTIKDLHLASVQSRIGFVEGKNILDHKDYVDERLKNLTKENAELSGQIKKFGEDKAKSESRVETIKNEKLSLENELKQLKLMLVQEQKKKSSCCQIFSLQEAEYDNEILNHKKLFDYLVKIVGIDKILNLGSILSENLIESALESDDYNLVLAGILSLEVDHL